jgi:hypothetical protein
MKYFMLLGFTLLTSCASVSEYNQGCRDGIGAVRVDGYSVVPTEKSKNDFCSALDEDRRTKDRLERQGNIK